MSQCVRICVSMHLLFLAQFTCSKFLLIETANVKCVSNESRSTIYPLSTALLIMQTSLRQAGSHLYRLAPLMMELARVCSAAVAALQGDAGPLALSSSQYIRPDGSFTSVSGIFKYQAHSHCVPNKPITTCRLRAVYCCSFVLMMSEHHHP